MYSTSREQRIQQTGTLFPLDESDSKLTREEIEKRKKAQIKSLEEADCPLNHGS